MEVPDPALKVRSLAVDLFSQLILVTVGCTGMRFQFLQILNPKH